MYATLSSPDSVTVHFPGVGPKTILSGSRNFNAVREAINSKEYNALLELMDPTISITNWGQGSLSVVNGMVHIDNEPLTSPALSKKVLEMWEAGFTIDPYIAFNQRMQELTSNRISRVLFPYLKKHSFPLFDDGAFMAYKGLSDNPHKGEELSDEKVEKLFKGSPQNPYTSINGTSLSERGYYKDLLFTSDYIDVHSGTVPQSIGDTITMEVRHVNDDPSEGCSTGLHVGSADYTSNYKVRVLVKVYPIDCIAVPLDSNFSKIRVSEYTLVEVDHIREEYTSPVYISSYCDGHGDEDEGDYDGEYDDQDCDEDCGEY